MERDVAWKKYDEADLEALEHLAAEYIDFISDNKTERECAASAVALAEEHGYLPLDQAVREGRTLKAGDKVWAQAHGKALILAHLGQKPLEQGLNILGAHIDSPRLDLKQNPLYESNGFTLFDTHYYGGIKNYQWVTLPLALHGVIAKKDGTVVDVQVGDDPDDPVFCVTDLLVHLAGKQMAKKANEVVEGEDLDGPLDCPARAELAWWAPPRLPGNLQWTAIRPRMSRLLLVKKKRRSPSRRSRLSCWLRSTASRKRTSCRPRSRSCPLDAPATWDSTAAW